MPRIRSLTRSRSRPRSRPRSNTRARRSRAPQRGGARTVLPISYFGGDDSSAYSANPGRSSFATAYGDSVPTNFGELGTSLGDRFAGPNLAPGSAAPNVNATDIQTGGGRKKARRGSRRGVQRKRSTRGSRRNTRRNSQRGSQRGGGGQYGRTVMPISYYGGDDTSAYNAPVGRSSFATAYGDSVATNFGTSAPEMGAEFAGPNLAPGGMGEFGAVTGIQTGGGKRRGGGERMR